MAIDQNVSEIIPILNEYNTAGWQDSLGSTTTPYNSLKLDVPIPDIPMPGIIDLTDRMKVATFDVGMKAYGSKGGGLVDWSEMDADRGKIPMYTTVNMTDTHNLLSDGKTWVPKYKNYIHGTNNEARLAAQQTTGEKLFNPVKRLWSNSLKGVLDVGAAAYGMVGAAFTGRLDTMWDNDFSHAIEKMTEETNLNYKNYYTEAQKKEGLGLNTKSWDTLLGGAEFTTRLLVGEGIVTALEAGATVATGGTALPSLLTAKGSRIGARIASTAGRVADKADDIARTGRAISRAVSTISGPELSAAARGVGYSEKSRKVANLVNATSDISEAAGKINRAADWQKRLKQARFALVTPSYEAGIEAREFRKRAENDFYDFYQKNYNRAPNAEEIREFSTKMDGAANTVFALNMGILGLSNLVLFGDLVGIKNPFTRAFRAPQEAFNKAVLGIGTRRSVDTGLHEAIKASTKQKIASYALPVLSSMAIEGVWEEGSQGIASKSLQNYVKSTYDPNYASATGELGEAFSKAIRDQYNTQEGIDEMIIGAIIGGLFGVRGGFANAAERKSQEGIAQVMNANEAFIKDLTGDGYRGEWYRALIGHGNRFHDLRERVTQAEESGDILEGAKAKRETLISLLQANHQVGKEAEFIKMLKASIQGMPDSEIVSELGISADQVGAYKDSVISELQNTADLYKKVFTAGQHWFKTHAVGSEGTITRKDSEGKDIQIPLNGNSYASALAYSAVMGDFYQDMAADSWNAIIQKVGNSLAGTTDMNKLNALGAIMSARNIYQYQFKEVSNKLEDVNNQLSEVEHKLSVSSTPNDGQGLDRAELVSKHESLVKLKQDYETKTKSLFKLMTQDFYEKMGQENYGDYLQLSDFTKMVDELNGVVDTMPYDKKQEVSNLISLFNESNGNYKDFANMYDKLMNPNAKIKGIQGLKTIFGDIMKPIANRQGKFASQEVKDALSAIIASAESPRNQGYFNELMTVSTSPITQEHIDRDDSIPSLNAWVSRRNRRGISLSELEQKYYDKFKDDVDNTSERPEKQVVLDPLIEEQEIWDELKLSAKAAKKRVEDFKNGIYTPEQQKKIDEYISKIESLEKSKSDMISEYQKRYDSIVKDRDDKIDTINSEIDRLNRELDTLTSFTEDQAGLEGLGYVFKDNGVYYKGRKVAENIQEVEKIKKHFEDNKKSLINLIRGELRKAELINLRFKFITRKLNKDTVEAILTPRGLAKNPELAGIKDLASYIDTIVKGGGSKSNRKGRHYDKKDRSRLERLFEDDAIVFNRDSNGNIKELTINGERYIVKVRGKYQSLDKDFDIDTDGTIKTDATGWRINFKSNKVFTYNVDELNLTLTKVIPAGTEVTDKRGKTTTLKADREVKHTFGESEASEILYRLLIDRINYENHEGAINRIETYIESFGEVIGKTSELESKYEAANIAESDAEVKIDDLNKLFGANMASTELELGDVRNGLNSYMKSEEESLSNEFDRSITKAQEQERRIGLTLDIRNRRPALVRQGMEDNSYTDSTLGQEFDSMAIMFLDKDSNGNYVLSSNSSVREAQEKVIERLNKRVDDKIQIQGDTIVFNPDARLRDSSFMDNLEKLNENEQELALLNEERYDPNAPLEEKVDWIINNFAETAGRLNSELDIPNILSKVPSVEDTTRYVELYNKGFNRTQEENSEFADLRKDLLSWGSINSLLGTEVVDTLNDLAHDVKEQEEEDIEEYTSEDIAQTLALSRVKQVHNPLVGLVRDVGIIRLPRVSNNDHEAGKISIISNLFASNILKRLSDKGYDNISATYNTSSRKNIDVGPNVNVAELLDNRVTNNELRGDVEMISVKVKNQEGRIIELRRDSENDSFYLYGDLNDFLNTLDFKVVQGSTKRGDYNQYVLLMEPDGNGNYKPVQGDSNIYSGSKKMVLDIDALNSLPIDSEVTLEFDPNDSYNKHLGNDLVTLVRDARIYIKGKNGEFLGTIKSLENLHSGNNSRASLATMRESIFKDYDPNSPKVLQSSAVVKNKYFNYYSSSIDSEGNYVLEDINSNDVDFKGYIQNNRLYDNSGKEVSWEGQFDPLILGGRGVNKKHVVALKSGVLLPLYPANAIIIDPYINTLESALNGSIPMDSSEVSEAVNKHYSLPPNTKVDTNIVTNVLNGLRSSRRVFDQTLTNSSRPYTAAKIVLGLTGREEQLNIGMVNTSMDNKTVDIVHDILQNSTCG